MGGRRTTAHVRRAVLAACLVAAACGDDDAGDPGTTTTTSGPPASTPAYEQLTPVPVAVRQVAEADFPTGMAQRPGTEEFYVVERAGTVRRLVRDGDQFTADEAVALDLTPEVGDDHGAEGGLVGIAFSPDGGHVYFSLTRDTDDAGKRRSVFEYAVGPDGIDASSQRTLFDFSVEAFVHIGGGLQFGPDGFLYVGFGDAGPFLDSNNTGQDTSDLLASILRVDPSRPDGASPYGIPEGNPFTDGGGAPEVWAFGLRNPWRFSFDPLTGDLWIGDVGDDEWEEIDVLPAEGGRDAGRGANLGWSIFEGSQRDEFRAELDAPDDHVPPVYEWSRGEAGCAAAVGGYVYRGEAIPELRGSYVFGDFCGTTIQRLVLDGDTVAVGDVVELEGLVSFATDASDELYAVANDGIWALVPATG